MREHLIRLGSGTAAPIAAVGLVYMLTLLCFERDGMWTTDNAARFLQVRALLQSGFASFAIPWPGRSIDPEFVYNPLPHVFSSVRGGELYSVFSPVFAMVSAVPYALLGYWGLYLLPFASALLMLRAVAGLCALAGGGLRARQGAVLIAGLGTPVWFYGVAFWEHCVAACLCLWALLFLARFVDAGAARDLVRAAVLVSLAVYFRDDLYLLCALLGLTAVSARRGDRLQTALRCGGRHGGLPGAALDLAVAGHGQPAGTTSVRPPVLLGGNPGAPPRPAEGVLQPVGRREPGPDHLDFPLGAVPLRLAAAAALRRFRLPHRPAPVRGGGGGERPDLLWAATSSGTATSPTCWPRRTACSRQRPWPSSPSRAAGTGRREAGWPCSSPPTPSSTPRPPPASAPPGLHWGNRFLLVLYPVWSLLAAVNLEQWRRRGGGGRRSWRFWSLAAVIAVSVGAQLFSVELLRRKKEFSHRLNDFVAARPEQAVVTSERWAGHELHRVFYDKPVFHIANPRAMDALRRKLKQAGYDRYLYLTRRQRVVGPRPAGEIGDGGLNWYGMRAFSGSTSPPRR